MVGWCCLLPARLVTPITSGLGPQENFQKGEKPAMRKVFVLCLLLCFVFALTAVAFDDMGKSSTVNGWVSDDKCGAKGANDKAEACTKKCLAAGAKMVIVTDKDQKVLMVENPDALKDHIGHHVAVTGHVMGDSIHVDSTKMIGM
jgi:hypothetical protein